MAKSLTLANVAFPHLVTFSTPGDGNCLFHAILFAYSKEYQQATPEQKKQIAVRFRHDLGDRLEQIDPISRRTYYEGLFHGKLPQLSETIPDYRLDTMKAALVREGPVDHYYQELISDSIHRDIYFLSASKGDVFLDTKEVYRLYYKGRNSIIILHKDGHYETVGLLLDQESPITCFPPEHKLIELLRNRLILHITRDY